MKRILILVLLLLSLAGSATSFTQQGPSENAALTTESDEQQSADEQRSAIVLTNTLGVVVLSDNNYDGDFIQIYNQDGSLWHRFTFYDKATVNDSEYTKEDFEPFAFRRDYFLLTFICIGKDEDRYEVIVNESTGLSKYVNIRDATLRFETWEEHILHVYGIDFNPKDNPPLDSPTGQPIDPTLYAPESPVNGAEVDGDWLRIEWLNEIPLPGHDPVYQTAWIRWKKDGKLLIDLHYLC